MSHPIDGRDQVILVDALDREIGAQEKLAAHRAGALHRAISVLVQRANGDVLLQRRASTKYHSQDLWTNTCCSHPRPGETTSAAASRRLQEEMGIGCTLRSVGRFTYRSTFDDGLIEHEIDHVFIGMTDGADPRPDPAEVGDWRWAPAPLVRWQSAVRPHWFTVWFPPVFDLATHRSARTL